MMTDHSTPSLSPDIQSQSLIRNQSSPPATSIRGSPPLGARFISLSINRRNGSQSNIICFSSAIETSISILQSLGFTGEGENKPRIITFPDLIRCPVLWGTLVAFRGYQGHIDFHEGRNDALLFLVGNNQSFDVLASAIDDLGAIDCFIPSLGLSLYDLLDLCLSRHIPPQAQALPDSPSSEDSDEGEIVAAAKTLSLLFNESRERGRSGDGGREKTRSPSPPPPSNRAPASAKPSKKRASDESGGIESTGLAEGIYRGYSKTWINCCASCGTRASPVWRKGWPISDTTVEVAGNCEEKGGSLFQQSQLPSRHHSEPPPTPFSAAVAPSSGGFLANLCNACGLQFAAGTPLNGDPRVRGGVLVSRRRTH